MIIATYSKTGATWLQQIVHGLRSGGAIDFEEIGDVVPWIGMAHDLNDDQGGAPRAFKSHEFWDDNLPKGCRYITIVRDPSDVAVSFYHFFEGWYFEPGAISLDTFVRNFFLSGSRSGRYWEHLASWWEQRARPDVLFLCYEDMKADLPATLRRIAGFLGLDGDPAAVDIATRQASFEFMRGHASQFDEHLLCDARDAACGLPPGAATTKVREAGVGSQALSLALREALDAAWRQVIEARFGYATYADMRAALRDG